MMQFLKLTAANNTTCLVDVGHINSIDSADEGDGFSTVIYIGSDSGWQMGARETPDQIAKALAYMGHTVVDVVTCEADRMLMTADGVAHRVDDPPA